MIKRTLHAAIPKNMPADVERILLRALVIFVAWKLLYHLALYPARVPDRQLTEATARSTGWLYTHLISNTAASVRDVSLPEFTKSTLLINNEAAIGIADGCNGLEIHILYVGFLLCIPASRTKMLSYIILGMTGIYILNVFRCFGLAWLYNNQYSIANFAHHYLFKMIIYLAVFLTWTSYSRKYFKNAV
jgi:exosortase/archaeosortase family protein